MDRDLTPIIVGVSQATFRDTDPKHTPLDAMTHAAQLALADASATGLREVLDCIVTVPFIAEQVPELASLFTSTAASGLAERLGVRAQLITSDFGGNLPQWFVNRCADRLAAGESRAVLISGAELMATLFSALRSGADISGWRVGGSLPSQNLGTGRDGSLPAERAHGLFEPIVTYPLFESALRHAHGITRCEQAHRTGQLVARMSNVAAGNPHAWRQTPLTAVEALSTDGGNRMISWPYTKCMNAIIAVNMAAAVVMTTTGEAKRLGICPSRWIYLQGGAEANDVWYAAERPDFYSSPALRAAGSDALRQAGIGIDDIDLFDIYSCFPAAVQVACDSLGLSPEDPRGVTVTGGLACFGGPGNNYSLHAIAEMVEQLRRRGHGRGLVSAVGGYLTKHAVGVYGVEPASRLWQTREPDFAQAQVALDDHPRLASHFSAGELTVEAHTVRFDRGLAVTGVVVGRLDDGQRCLAHCTDDAALLQRLINEDCVGLVGHVEPGEPVNRFSLSGVPV